MSCGMGNSIFGSSGGYIKFMGSDIVSVEGPNIAERLLLGDLKSPYKQILKGRVILKAGQLNYLMNHLSMGDNATFLAVSAKYDPKSVIEEDNYVQYNYYNDFGRTYTFSQILVLTGNSTHRIPQIYITNPNNKYPVLLEIMVGVIDDNYSFYNDVVNNSGISITNLTYNSIETYVVNESIVVYDNSDPRLPSAYITLNNINSIEKSGKILIIDDSSIGRIFMEFVSDYDANQSLSLVSYSMRVPGVIIQNLSSIIDNECPIINFNNTSGVGGYPITMTGSTMSGPYNTSQGTEFYTNISMAQFGTYGMITKEEVTSLLIDSMVDNRDGDISVDNSNIILKNASGLVVSSIGTIGRYLVGFTASDIAGNFISDSIALNINIIA